MTDVSANYPARERGGGDHDVEYCPLLIETEDVGQKRLETTPGELWVRGLHPTKAERVKARVVTLVASEMGYPCSSV